jgi:hypothetical protein
LPGGDLAATISPAVSADMMMGGASEGFTDLLIRYDFNAVPDWIGIYIRSC